MPFLDYDKHNNHDDLPHLDIDLPDNLDDLPPLEPEVSGYGVSSLDPHQHVVLQLVPGDNKKCVFIF